MPGRDGSGEALAGIEMQRTPAAGCAGREEGCLACRERVRGVGEWLSFIYLLLLYFLKRRKEISCCLCGEINVTSKQFFFKNRPTSIFYIVTDNYLYHCPLYVYTQNLICIIITCAIIKKRLVLGAGRPAQVSPVALQLFD